MVLNLVGERIHRRGAEGAQRICFSPRELRVLCACGGESFVHNIQARVPVYLMGGAMGSLTLIVPLIELSSTCPLMLAAYDLP